MIQGVIGRMFLPEVEHTVTEFATRGIIGREDVEP
jgi:hypothetical protein